METRKTKLGLDHPDTLSSMANLAWTFHHQGRKNEARDVMDEAMWKSQVKLGETHPDTIDRVLTLLSWTNLASN